MRTRVSLEFFNQSIELDIQNIALQISMLVEVRVAMCKHIIVIRIILKMWVSQIYCKTGR